MPAKNLGRDDKHFQELMGRGGMISIAPKPVQQPHTLPDAKQESVEVTEKSKTHP